MKTTSSIPLFAGRSLRSLLPRLRHSCHQKMKAGGLRALVSLVLIAGASTAVAAPTGPFGTQAQSYAVPSGTVVYVSPTGTGSGASLSDPTSVRDALKNSPSGSTVVFRGGTYRTGGIFYGRNLTLQPYLDEVPVLKGSEVVTGWSASGSKWVATWNSLYPRAAPSFENGNKAVWNQDMVIVDGTPKTQVELVSQVAFSTFHINYDTNTVTIGVNPTGKTIEMTAQKSGITRMPATGDNLDVGTVQGLTFMHYAAAAFDFGLGAPNGNVAVNTYGALVPNGRFFNNRFLMNGTGSGRLCGDDLIVRGNEFANNGFIGIDIQNSNRAVIEENWIHSNNYQNIANYPAGIKVFNQCSEVMVRNNLVENNKANGIWLDVGITDSAVVHNLVRNNSQAQIHFEISINCVIAGNLIVGDTAGGHGIFVQNAASAHIYNNTIWGTRDAIAMKRNERDNDGTSIGWHADTGPGPGNYEHNVIANNLMSTPRNGIAFIRAYETGDGIGADFDQPVDYMDYNAYYRPNASSPTTFMQWAPNPANYNTLASFRSAYPQFETHSIEFTGGTEPFFVNPTSDFQLKSGSNAIRAGRPLPANVAAATGWPVGVVMDLGAYQSFSGPSVVEAEDATILSGTIKSDVNASNEAYVDGGAGFNLTWVIAVDAQRVDVPIRIQAPSGSRSMGLFVNGSLRGTVSTLSSEWSIETVPAVWFRAGENTVELRDSEGTAELNVDYIGLPLRDEIGVLVSAGDFDEESDPGDDNSIRVTNGVIGYIRDGTWAKYANFDFGSGISSFGITAATPQVNANRMVEARLDSPNGTLIAEIEVTTTGGWGGSDFSAFSALANANVTGVHDLYLVFRTGSFNVQDFHFTRDLDVGITASSYDTESNLGDDLLVKDEGSNVGYIKDGTWVGYYDFDFEEGVDSIDVVASSDTVGGNIELRLGSATGSLIGTVAVTTTGGWQSPQTFSASSLGAVNGVHDLYMVFTASSSDYLFNLMSFEFITNKY